MCVCVCVCSNMNVVHDFVRVCVPILECCGSWFWGDLFVCCLFVCVSVHVCVTHTFGLCFALYKLNPVTCGPDRLVVLN